VISEWYITERSDKENETREIVSAIEWYEGVRTRKENLNERKSAISRPLNGNIRRKGIYCHDRNGRK
jgi:hypothetical protein